MSTESAAVTPEMPIGQIAVLRPAAVAVFRRLELDFWTQGRTPLREACAARNLDPTRVLQAVQEREKRIPAENPRYQRSRVPEEPNAALIRRIESNHHSFARIALRRLEALIDQFSDHATTIQVETFSCQFQEHLLREETLLFPRLSGVGHSEVLADLCQALEAEHRALFQAAQAIQGSVQRLPESPSKRLFLGCLQELIEDSVEHFHLESNLLFERVRQEGSKDVRRRKR